MTLSRRALLRVGRGIFPIGSRRATGHHRGMTTEQPQATQDPRLLRRRATDRVIGGVAAGIADYLNIDPVLVRAIFVGLVIFGGAGLVLYLGAWLLIPIEGRDDLRWSSSCHGLAVPSILLVILGCSFLFRVVLPIFDWRLGITFPALILVLVASASTCCAAAGPLRQGDPRFNRGGHTSAASGPDSFIQLQSRHIDQSPTLLPEASPQRPYASALQR